MHWQYGWLDVHAIGRKECYWAVVPADRNLLGSCTLLYTIYLYRALVAGQIQP